MAVVTFSPCQLIIVGLAATVACHGGGSGNLAPAPATPEATVEQFLTAANASDLNAMATLWGTENGPESATQTMKPEIRHQRLEIMQRLLKSDSHQITATNQSNPMRPVLTVAMNQGTRRYAVPFTMVQSRAGGWLITDIDLSSAMPTAGPRQTPGN